MREWMAGWNEISCNAVADMKRDGVLELLWKVELTNCLHCYKTNVPVYLT